MYVALGSLSRMRLLAPTLSTLPGSDPEGLDPEGLLMGHLAPGHPSRMRLLALTVNPVWFRPAGFTTVR